MDPNDLICIRNILNKIIEIEKSNHLETILDDLKTISINFDKLHWDSRDQNLIRNRHGFKNRSKRNIENIQGAKIDFEIFTTFKETFVFQYLPINILENVIDQVKESISNLKEKINIVLEDPDGEKNMSSTQKRECFLFELCCYMNDKLRISFIISELNNLKEFEQPLDIKENRYRYGFIFIRIGETARKISEKLITNQDLKLFFNYLYQLRMLAVKTDLLNNTNDTRLNIIKTKVLEKSILNKIIGLLNVVNDSIKFNSNYSIFLTTDSLNKLNTLNEHFMSYDSNDPHVKFSNKLNANLLKDTTTEKIEQIKIILSNPKSSELTTYNFGIDSRIKAKLKKAKVFKKDLVDRNLLYIIVKKLSTEFIKIIDEWQNKIQLLQMIPSLSQETIDKIKEIKNIEAKENSDADKLIQEFFDLALLFNTQDFYLKLIGENQKYIDNNNIFSYKNEFLNDEQIYELLDFLCSKLSNLNVKDNIYYNVICVSITIVAPYFEKIFKDISISKDLNPIWDYYWLPVVKLRNRLIHHENLEHEKIVDFNSIILSWLVTWKMLEVFKDRKRLVEAFEIGKNLYLFLQSTQLFNEIFYNLNLVLPLVSVFNLRSFTISFTDLVLFEVYFFHEKFYFFRISTLTGQMTILKINQMELLINNYQSNIIVYKKTKVNYTKIKIVIGSKFNTNVINNLIDNNHILSYNNCQSLSSSCYFLQTTAQRMRTSNGNPRSEYLKITRPIYNLHAFSRLLNACRIQTCFTGSMENKTTINVLFINKDQFASRKTGERIPLKLLDEYLIMSLKNKRKIIEKYNHSSIYKKIFIEDDKSKGRDIFYKSLFLIQEI
ncbi:unnamed protein product [Brachionus calyciflorus]|uniref:Uncharacterized protein n=1 Tax=Brachionus calyciflorus TaxID=104777 RepID=A0A814BM39_9BILA|nr:unnamed protein product [Brachionus calyciflorus]